MNKKYDGTKWRANTDQMGVWVCKAKTESRNIFF